MASPADGTILLDNYASTSFALLQFGGATSSFPALKRNATALQVRLSDDSADAPLTASSLALGGATIGSNALAVTGTSALGSGTLGGGFVGAINAIGSSSNGGTITQIGRAHV